MKKIILGIILLIVLFFFLFRRNFKRNLPNENLQNLSIAIINGSGDRLASVLFNKYLQKYNFLVSYVIEINDTFEKTIVIEHIDKNLKNGKIIQKYLGYKKPKRFLFWKINKSFFFNKEKYPPVHLFVDSTLNLSASIILGKDYSEIIKNGDN
ncbi:MAG: hypothetical protein ABIK78_01945 [candidate division WOR-3 bacterium]